MTTEGEGDSLPAKSDSSDPVSNGDINAERANVRAQQVILSNSAFPSIPEMEWLHVNTPEFFDAYTQSMLDESSHRRELENKSVNSTRYLVTIAAIVIVVVALFANPWAAAALGAAASVFYAVANFVVFKDGSAPQNNLTFQGQHYESERERETPSN